MNREQCKGCAYFRRSGCKGGGFKFCHYLLFTGERRKVGENEKCLSKSNKVRKAVVPFEVYAPQA